MTRSRTILSIVAATVGFSLAVAPVAFADDMSNGSATTKTDTMGKKKDDGMKKTMPDDKMSKDTMTKDGMKKDDMKK